MENYSSRMDSTVNFIYIIIDEKWKRYLEVLQKINEKEKPFLCGIDPKKKPEELDAEEDVTVD